MERLKVLIARAKAMPVIRTVVAVQDRYGRDGAGYMASTIAYHAFVSLFPLLLVGLSVAGYVLVDPDARASFSRTISGAVPGLQPLIGDSVDALVSARGVAGIAGLLGLVWTGTGVVRAAGYALDRVFAIDHAGDSFLKQNTWALGSLLALGAMAAASMGLSFGGSLLPGEGLAGLAMGAAMMIVGWIVDVWLFVLAYRILTRRRGPAWRALARGAVLAAGGWTALKLVGALYAQNTVAGAQAVYGTFAGALGVLVMLSVGARIFMYGAELNAVRIDREAEIKGDADAETLRGRRRVA